MTNLSIYSDNLNITTPVNMRKQSIDTVDTQQSDYYMNSVINQQKGGNKVNLNLTRNDSALTEQRRMDTISIIQHKYAKSTTSTMSEFDDRSRDNYTSFNINNHKGSGSSGTSGGSNDEEKGHHHHHENVPTRFKYSYHDYYNKKQIKLLNVTSRIALTSFIAMISFINISIDMVDWIRIK